MHEGRCAAKKHVGRLSQRIAEYLIGPGSRWAAAGSALVLSLEQVRAMISAKQAKGWTFAFLAAGLDGYGEAARWATPPAPPSLPRLARRRPAAWSSTSEDVRRKRSYLRRGEDFDR